MSSEDGELDPRIQIELENLNTATDDINKLEIELEEANSTFRILLNESTRRLKLSSKKLGNCIEKARPYYDALEKAREAQIECQKAAVKFQRANEIHAAAKETVALAEQRFMSNSHEWQFDNAWQEMLNHATQKVMDAEKQKADSHAEHQRRTIVFNAAEVKVQQLEERFRRSIAKSRPYFEEKQICQDQLQTQKNRIQELQASVQVTKKTYATALRNLERISDDIHRQRGDYPGALQLSTAPPQGPREPGVGAELNSPTTTTSMPLPSLPDFELELEKCEYQSGNSFAGSQMSLGGASLRSTELKMATLATMEDVEFDEDEEAAETELQQKQIPTDVEGIEEQALEALRQKVKILAVRPIEGGDGQQQHMWEHELNATVNKLDQLMLQRESARSKQQHQHQQLQRLKQNVRPDSLGAEAVAQHRDELYGDAPMIKITSAADIVKTISVDDNSNNGSLPATPAHIVKPLKQLQKLAPLPSVNVSMRELPLLARLSHEVLDQATSVYSKQRRRSLE